MDANQLLLELKLQLLRWILLNNDHSLRSLWRHRVMRNDCPWLLLLKGLLLNPYARAPADVDQLVADGRDYPRLEWAAAVRHCRLMELHLRLRLES